MDTNETKVVMRVLKQHEARLVLLTNRVKFLEKRLDNLKACDVQRMV